MSGWESINQIANRESTFHQAAAMLGPLLTYAARPRSQHLQNVYWTVSFKRHLVVVYLCECWAGARW